MITLYEDGRTIQLLDGQQRFITLALIFRYLGKSPFRIEFERDIGIRDTRSNFISRLPQTLDREATAFSDKRRLMYNFDRIAQTLDNGGLDDKEDFYRHIMGNVQMLVHITTTPPIDEFLNLNTHKTRFSVCDRVRSALIINNALYPPEDEQFSRARNMQILENEDYITGVSQLFDALTKALYNTDGGKDDSFYRLVSSNYHQPYDSSKKRYESRLNIVFSRYSQSGGSDGYSDEDEGKLSDINGNAMAVLQRLVFFLRQLHSLRMGGHNVRSIYKALADRFSDTRFFEVMDRFYTNYEKRTDANTLSDILHERCSADYALFRYITEAKGIDDQLIMVNRYFHLDIDGETPESSELENTLEISKKKHDLMDKHSFKNVVSNAGKYLLRRYHEEKTAAEADDLYFDEYIPHKLPVRGSETPQLGTTVPIGQLLFGDDADYILEIPVIQRDYCMGSRLADNGFIDYLLINFATRTPITLSAVTVNETTGSLRIFDGQQRIVTLSAILAALGEREGTRSILFEHRADFTEQLDSFRKSGRLPDDTSPRSYSELSLKKAAESLVNIHDSKAFAEYLMTKVSVAVVKVDGQVDTVEQYFIDINGGVALKPYEIFKSMLNHRCTEVTDAQFAQDWKRKIDNSWLDHFYKFCDPKASDEEAREELMEMLFIEYCLRMIYWDKHPDVDTTELNGFGTIDSRMGDSVKFIEELDEQDFVQIDRIMDIVINTSMPDKCPTIITRNSADGSFIFKSSTTLADLLCCFCNSLIYIHNNYSDRDRKCDRLLWWVLSGENITSCIAYWNAQNQLTEPVIIAESEKQGDYIRFTLNTYDAIRFIPSYYGGHDDYDRLKSFNLIDSVKITDMLNKTATASAYSTPSKRMLLYKYAKDNDKTCITYCYTTASATTEPQFIRINDDLPMFFALPLCNGSTYYFCFTKARNISIRDSYSI